MYILNITLNELGKNNKNNSYIVIMMESEQTLKKSTLNFYPLDS